VREQRYANGKRVLHDFESSRSEFMRDVLTELGKLDDVGFTDLGYKRGAETTNSLQRTVHIFIKL